MCTCSAGNSADQVEWPAAFKATVGVSALGRKGWGPERATGHAWVPREPDRFGGEKLFLASFSCFGSGINCAGPGVGIISTVPERFGLKAPYAAMDGTSLSSPAVCGALAGMLSESRNYKALPRNAVRTHFAREMLERHCQNVGLDMLYQGNGVPRMPVRRSTSRRS